MGSDPSGSAGAVILCAVSKKVQTPIKCSQCSHMTYLRYGYNSEIGWLLLCAVLSSDFQLFLQPAPMAQLGALPEKAAPGLFCNT